MVDLKARAVLLILFLSFALFYVLLFPILVALFADAYLFSEALIDVTFHLFVFAILMGIVRNRVTLYGLWPGKLPNKREVFFYLLLACPMVGMSCLTLVLVFLPLSYSLPGVVEFFFEGEFQLWVHDGSFVSLASSLMKILSLVILAPVLEEIIFRWLLIERWKAKYSTRTAVITSSLIFGVLHADIIGAFLFGVILSAIYLHTRSLWGPILVHVGNNGLVAVFILMESPSDMSAVAELQTEWPMIVLVGFAMLVPGLWISRYLGASRKFRAVFTSEAG